MEERGSANHEATDREAALRDLLLKRSAEPTPSTGDATERVSSADYPAPAEPKRRRRRWGDSTDEAPAAAADAAAEPPATEGPSRSSRWGKQVQGRPPPVVGQQPAVLIPASLPLVLSAPESSAAVLPPASAAGASAVAASAAAVANVDLAAVAAAAKASEAMRAVQASIASFAPGPKSECLAYDR